MYIIETLLREDLIDHKGIKIANEIRNFLNISIRSVKKRIVYFINTKHSIDQIEKAAAEFLCDPITQEFSINKSIKTQKFDYSILVSYKPGVTDNLSSTVNKLFKKMFNYKYEKNDYIISASQYLLKGVSKKEAKIISEELLSNCLIENVIIQSFNDYCKNGLNILEQKIFPETKIKVNEIDLNISDNELKELSSTKMLALNINEMKAIRDHFNAKRIIKERKKIGLSKNPTHTEIEVLAQTWSEHCSHKIFNSNINYEDENGKKIVINSLFKDYIKKITKEVNSSWLLSVFKDNAGVIKFNDDIALVYKVETHNSPSALDPFGGAMTGIVGVNRDPLGTGLGAELIANVWGYCFGNPFSKNSDKAILHPNRIREGVHKGVIEGGNQSGIPYMRGFEIFEDRFAGKPLVFCGTLAQMPLNIQDKKSYEKEIVSGDLIVMVGGKVGKDGIHGATFSSEELHCGSPVQAVQIGDPITQKKMADMLIEARDKLLYRAITDNGAGGLSSSIGEMALFSNGCEVDLSKVPLKYSGLKPWEIIISEAQERMTIAVSPEKIDEFMELSSKREVISTVIGKFIPNNKFHIKYGNKTVAYLDLDLLHNGNPGYDLKAKFIKKVFKEPKITIEDHKIVLRDILKQLNICSNEKKARQYDHEVKGKSIIKPFSGINSDIPSDASVMLASYNSLEGIILTEGIAPFYSDIDTYWMAASIVDEALRKVVSVGGKLDYIAGIDNFCWPNVVKENMPERSYKLAQLVRANQGLYDICVKYSVPLISGKDSMSNDCTIVEPPISVPPTLLFSVVSKINDITNCITIDIKKPNDLIYIVGKTKNELGASEFYRYYGEKNQNKPFIGNNVPKVDTDTAMNIYRKMEKAINKKIINSSITPTRGGIAIALCKTLFAGEFGADIDLSKVKGNAETDIEILYSESNSRFILTISEENKKEFENIFKDNISLIGKVRNDKILSIKGINNKIIIKDNIMEMKKIWKSIFC